MRKPVVMCVLISFTWLGVGLRTTIADPAGKTREMSVDEFRDRIRGGWAGKMFGVAFGYPTEFDSNGKIIEGEIGWEPSRVDNALTQDDLYVGMTLAETMDRLGLDATTADYGEAFKDTRYKLWHANAAARRLLNLGIMSPDSGHPKFNIHANDIDFQIEADFIGLMCPGMPQQSNKYCDRVGRVMNYGDGLYGGMFVSGMYASAYFETDVRKVVEDGLACLPAGSSYAALIRDVLEMHESDPEDWKACWHMLDEKWDKHDSCIDGALEEFNIDAKLNGGYVALGLLYGQGYFTETIEIATRAGQDSDCNPSTAAGILGVMQGYSAIPERWKSGIPAIEDKKFQYTSSSLNDVCDSTFRRATLLVEKCGGKVTNDAIHVVVERPEPATLEQWSMGIPHERISHDDPSFTFSDEWTEVTHRRTRHLAADAPGATMQLRFEGTAVALVGDCTPNGGRADVYLDGEKVQGIDAYAGWATRDNALWHAYDLAPGAHELRVVLREDADARSEGNQVMIATAVTYENEPYESP